MPDTPICHHRFRLFRGAAAIVLIGAVFLGARASIRLTKMKVTSPWSSSGLQVQARETSTTPPVPLHRFRLFWGVSALVLIGAAFLGANVVSNRLTKIDVGSSLTNGDSSRAPPIFRRYGCTGCHTIPGIAGADGQVGGPLVGISKRVYIGGVLPNSTDNLVGWIVWPQRYSPHTAMPASGISDAEAKDLVAYLYSR
jgi:cytochrome c